MRVIVLEQTVKIACKTIHSSLWVFWYLSHALYSKTSVNGHPRKRPEIDFHFLDHSCNICLMFIILSCASAYWCLVVTCWERADLLALVCDVYCEFVTFPLVSSVRCGTWLYRFLIFARILTFHDHNYHLMQVKSIAECSKRSILQYFLNHFFVYFWVVLI